ncbi:MAG: hypothetical protein M3144_11345, partial [Actinomycetota bacterium]|nr:hypothetical protein [Actinomycetota bacterium]
PLAIPFCVYLFWALAVGMVLDPATSGDDANPLADALSSFQLPFQTWFEIGLLERPVLMGILLTFGSAVAAAVLWNVIPELSLWLLADAVLLVISAPVIALDLLNYCRVAPLALPAVVLALALQRRATSHPQLAPTAAPRPVDR